MRTFTRSVDANFKVQFNYSGFAVETRFQPLIRKPRNVAIDTNYCYSVMILSVVVLLMLFISITAYLIIYWMSIK